MRVMRHSFAVRICGMCRAYTRTDKRGKALTDPRPTLSIALQAGSACE
jgi:hypothetical protein